MFLSGMCVCVCVAEHISVSEWYCPSRLSPVWAGSLAQSLCSPQSSQSCQPSWTWSTSNGIAFKSISVLCWWALVLSQISPRAASLFIPNSSVLSPRTWAVMHTHTHACYRVYCEHTHTHRGRSVEISLLWPPPQKKKKKNQTRYCFTYYLFFSPRSVQWNKKNAQERLGSRSHFQNGDYCVNPPGLVFFCEHSGDVSPKSSPMVPRPLT